MINGYRGNSLFVRKVHLLVDILNFDDKHDFNVETVMKLYTYSYCSVRT